MPWKRRLRHFVERSEGSRRLYFFHHFSFGSSMQRGISTDRVIFLCANNTRFFLTDLTRIAPVIRIDRVHFSFNLRANKSIIGRRAEGEERDRSFNRFQVDRSIGFVGAHLGRPIFRCFGTE